MQLEVTKCEADTKSIEIIFEKLILFMDTNVDARIMQRAPDITTFMHKSFTDLQELQKSMQNQRNFMYIDRSYKV